MSRRSKEERVVTAGANIASAEEIGDIAYQHTVLTQCGIPRKRTDEPEWERRNGNASLLISAGKLWNGQDWIRQGLPYGTYPRLFSIYIASRVIRTGSREVDIGHSTREMLRRLGKGGQGGANGPLTHFRKQAKALAAAHVTLGVPGKRGGAATVNAQPISEFEAWMVDEEGQTVMWPGHLIVSEDYAATLADHAVPLATEAVRGIQNSALELDLYQWLAQRLHRIPANRPLHLTWKQLRNELAPEYGRVRNFKNEALKGLRSVYTVYPEARFEVDVDGSGLVLRHSKPPVSYRRVSDGG